MIRVKKQLSLALISIFLLLFISGSNTLVEIENITIHDISSAQSALDSGLWIKSNAPLKSYDYSFAVIGDTQMITRYYPDKLSCIYDWIVNNTKSKKIKYVFGLGDITDSNSKEEWAIAKREIGKLDGIVAYSLVRGNHDSVGRFNTTFGKNSSYLKEIDGSYDNTVNNTYNIFTAGDTDYLALNLDYCLDENVLMWAEEVVSTHPNHNVIVTIHTYLTKDGTTLDSKDLNTPTSYGANYNGEDLWNKLISRHKNIVMILSGHISSGRIILSQAKGLNGNIVSQLLIDPQGLDFNKTIGATGLVAMFYISDNGTVQIEYYSTVKDKYYMKDNQFTFQLSKVEPTYGDVNDDASVDLKDIIRLKKYLTDIEVKINNRTADCNIDKIINSADLITLRRKILSQVL